MTRTPGSESPAARARAGLTQAQSESLTRSRRDNRPRPCKPPGAAAGPEPDCQLLTETRTRRNCCPGWARPECKCQLCPALRLVTRTHEPASVHGSFINLIIIGNYRMKEHSFFWYQPGSGSLLRVCRVHFFQKGVLKMVGAAYALQH